MDDLDKAKKELVENGYTCVLCKENEIFCSDKRGVKPLVEFIESGKNFSGFSAADKTIGAGAAHIYVLLGIKKVWAKVISRDGENIFKENNICVAYEKKVPYIINRTGDDRCPIEKCVQDVSDSKEAFELIKKTLANLAKGKNANDA